MFRSTMKNVVYQFMMTGSYFQVCSVVYYFVKVIIKNIGFVSPMRKPYFCWGMRPAINFFTGTCLIISIQNSFLDFQRRKSFRLSHGRILLSDENLEELLGNAYHIFKVSYLLCGYCDVRHYFFCLVKDKNWIDRSLFYSLVLSSIIAIITDFKSRHYILNHFY